MLTQEKKMTTDVFFQKIACKEPWNIRTQEVDQPVESWDEIETYIRDMLDDGNQFVTLTAEKINSNIRYVQASQYGCEIVVQLGIEEGEYTRLVEKMCTEEECLDIFREYFFSTHVRNPGDYSPVKFYV
ncbi:MAG: hypothetical protein K2O18_15340 [Oscillospiraceae bacterium]|nr:hypothetical protein [Oscillospiraceae bacterium]